MPSPVMVPCIVHRHFGSEYAVVSPEASSGTGPGARPPYGVILGSVVPAPSYAHLVDRWYDDAFADAQQASVTFAVVGRLEGLPRYEVVDQQGVTLSEHLVLHGYAVPNEAALVGHPRADQLIAALRTARATEAGIWSEWTADSYRDTLPFTLVAQTNPPMQPTGMAGMGVISVMVVVILMAILALRDANYRAQGGRRSPLRRFGAMMIGAYGAGGYRGLNAEQLDHVRGVLRPSADPAPAAPTTGPAPAAPTPPASGS
jgi:hypothetical protein